MSEAITAPDAAAGGAAVPPAPSAPPAPPVASPTAGGAPDFDWKSALGDKAELAALVEAKKWKSPADALASYQNLEGMVGRKGLIPPKEGDPPEVAAAYRAALGVPEKPEGYEFKQPEGVSDLVWTQDGLGKLRTWAHELGLTPAQAQGFAERLANDQADFLRSLTEGIDADGRKFQDVLREEWGADYAGKIERGKRAANALAERAKLEDRQRFENFLQTELGGRDMFRFLAFLGEEFGEDQPAGMGTGRGGAPDTSAELRRYYEPGTPEHAAYTQPLHPRNAEAQARVKALFAAGAKL